MTTGVEEDQRDGLWTAAQFVTAIRARGASQGHIARILGVSVASVSRWESGERTPSRGVAWHLEDLHRDLTSWDAVVHNDGYGNRHLVADGCDVQEKAS